jgi:hypothetical protein
MCVYSCVRESMCVGVCRYRGKKKKLVSVSVIKHESAVCNSSTCQISARVKGCAYLQQDLERETKIMMVRSDYSRWLRGAMHITHATKK